MGVIFLFFTEVVARLPILAVDKNPTIGTGQ